MDVFTNFDIEGYMQYSALIIGFTSGIVAIYLIDGVRSRLKVLLKGILIAVPILVVLVLLEQTNLMVRWDYLVSGASAGILSVVLFMAVLPIFESLFKRSPLQAGGTHRPQLGAHPPHDRDRAGHVQSLHRRGEHRRGLRDRDRGKSPSGARLRVLSRHGQAPSA